MTRLFLIGIMGPLLAFSAGDPLEAVLAKMDQSAAGFKGLSADLRKVHHTGVIDENTEDVGTIFIKRPKPHETRMLFDVKQPDRKQFAFDGRKGEEYLPKANTVEEYDLSKYRGLVDQFLLLGFGTSSKELRGAYTISYAGEEKVAGEKTGRIQLIPKSQDALAHLTKVDLWISDSAGVPVQQKFYEPSGDYDLATYTNIKLNPNIPDAALKLELPKGVKREYPGR